MQNGSWSYFPFRLVGWACIKYENQSGSSALAEHDLIVHFYHIQCAAYLGRYACFCDRNSLHCDSAVVVVRTVFWQAATCPSAARQSVSQSVGPTASGSFQI